MLSGQACFGCEDSVGRRRSNGRFDGRSEDARQPRKSLEKRREKALAGIV